MKIDAIEIYRVAMPLIYPWRTAYGEDYAIESVLVKMRSGDLTGWGEATPLASPQYSPEWAAGVYILVRDWLGPRLLNEEIESGDQLQERLTGFKGNRFAKASLDMAWWDLQAKRAGKPLWRLLGGSSATVEVGAAFGVMETIDALIEAIEGAVKSGFKRVKLKFRPGWDLDVVGAVRCAYPKLTLHVDCNSAFQLDDLGVFQALDQFGLAMIEQPLAYDDLLDHAKLQQRIQTPICLDESLVSPETALKAIELGAARWFNIKPGRVGGITRAVKIIQIAERAAIPCWIGGMLESAIGASYCLALATLPNMKYPSDLVPSRRFYQKDLAQPELELSGPSRMTASEEVGIGCAPNEEQLRAQIVETSQIGTS
jgi:O-succinylbenzoate synthase